MDGSMTARIAVAAVFAIAACSDETTDPSTINDFNTTMFATSGTAGSGSATFEHTTGSLAYTIEFNGLLQAGPTEVAIHEGGPGTDDGPIQLYLCNADPADPAPDCPGGIQAGQDDPNGAAGTYYGSIAGVADDTYLVEGATMAGVVDDMRGFGAYITMVHADGELRGNIVGVY